jgi:hypothetical protein
MTAVGKSGPIERERDLEHWVLKLTQTRRRARREQCSGVITDGDSPGLVKRACRQCNYARSHQDSSCNAAQTETFFEQHSADDGAENQAALSQGGDGCQGQYFRCRKKDQIAADRKHARQQSHAPACSREGANLAAAANRREDKYAKAG